jgi:hypothetical protein
MAALRPQFKHKPTEQVMSEVNGSAVELNLGAMSLEQLVEQHNEMVATAVDFGLSAEVVAAFGSVAEGIAACERLHTSIERARERAAAPPKKERARAKSRAKKASENAVEDAAKQAGAVVAGYTEPKAKEKTVAKKTKTAKKAKSAAKRVAKKANGERKSGPRLSGDTKITWLAEGNPARKGSIFYDRVEKVRKAKTIDGLVKAGGIRADAAEVAKRGWAKLSA